MSKGTNPQREQKKKPQKSLSEKRAVKKAKKVGKSAVQFL
jgi:hypothetical protein